MISVVILSYNTREITLRCLECLYKSEGVKFEVIVVDNASSDGSAEAITKKFPEVILIKNKLNTGFAKGNNQGMKRARGEKILLLNSDCFVEKDTLVNLPDKDVVGCRLLNGDGSVQASWGYFPTLRRIIQLMLFVDNFPIVRGFIDSIHVRDLSRYENEQEVDWVTGAFVMLKRDVFEKVGGIDEKYFMYGEEVEWLYRIKRAGFKVWYTPKAQANHLWGASVKDKSKIFMSEMRGYMYWYQKHGLKREQILLNIVLLFGCIVRIPAWWVMGEIMGKLGLHREYIKILPELWNEIFDRSRR